MTDPPRNNLRRCACSCAPALLAGLLALAGCAHTPPAVYGAPGVSPSPDLPWTPPARALERPAARPPAAPIPKDLLEASQHWTMMDVIDLALRNSPQTRLAWAAARSAAAAYGSRQGAYLPSVNLNGSATAQKGTTGGGKSTFTQKSSGATVDATWLLFNFGGREAAIDEARQALTAADFTHNAAIQTVILQVEEAYYQYATAQALLKAEEATVEEATANLDAAQDRHQAGAATIADVLQARTALSQAQLALESLQGQVQTTQGVLATAMGLPANTGFGVELMPEEPPVEQITEAVERYLSEAQANRPDLAAARALVWQAGAHLRNVKASGLPSITTNGNLGRTRYEGTDHFTDTYTASVQLHFPLFTGGSHRYDLLQATADAAVAQARLDNLEQTVTLQVWTSYYNLRTAEQRLHTSQDLLKSATESHEVAMSRYKAGAGSILDLLVAQAALENARAQSAASRATWFLSLAQLAHDTGSLGRSEKGKEGKP